MRFKKVIAVISIIAIGLIAAGCGDNGVSGYTAGEDFTFGDNTYALEKWVRIPKEDTNKYECYGVCMLIEGNSAPIIMSFGSDQPQSTVDMKLVKDDDTTYKPIGIGFDGIDDQGKYGVRMTFKFKLPKGEELPEMGKLINTNDKKEKADLNLTSITVEE